MESAREPDGWQSVSNWSSHSMSFDARHFNTADLVADAFREDLEIVAGVLAGECAQFYYKPGEDPPAEVII